MTPRARLRRTRPIAARTAFALCAVVVTSCRSRPADDAPLRGAFSADAGRAPQPATSVDVAGSIYPRNLPPHAKAVELCDSLHGAVARKKAECCGGAPSSFLASECERTLGATLHAGTAELDEAVALRCVNAVEESAASCDSVTPSPSPLPAVCHGLLRGKIERGKVCRSSLECEGDLHCEGLSPTRTGVCTPPGRLGAGCGVHVDVLATYLGDRDLATDHPICADFCSIAAHKCEPVPPAGAPCLATVNCASGQRCIAGQCSATALVARGGPCGAVPCEAGLRCVSGTCEPLAETGEACRSDDDCKRGGCNEADDGRSICGAKCSASLGILRRQDAGPAMRLPRARRAEPDAR